MILKLDTHMYSYFQPAPHVYFSRPGWIKLLGKILQTLTMVKSTWLHSTMPEVCVIRLAIVQYNTSVISYTHEDASSSVVKFQGSWLRLCQSCRQPFSGLPLQFRQSDYMYTKHMYEISCASRHHIRLDAGVQSCVSLHGFCILCKNDLRWKSSVDIKNNAKWLWIGVFSHLQSLIFAFAWYWGKKRLRSQEELVHSASPELFTMTHVTL